MTNASATNQVRFGDNDTGAGENADVVYSYVAYYNTAWNPPQSTAGSISEFAVWQGNMKALWPLLYNSGSFVSVKTLCGVPGNYLDKSDKIPAKVQRGITSQPSTASATPLTLAEMEAFVVGESVELQFYSSVFNTANNPAAIVAYLDGVQLGSIQAAANSINTQQMPIAIPSAMAKSFFGLHKAEGRFLSPDGSSTAYGHSTRRSLDVKAKP